MNWVSCEGYVTKGSWRYQIRYRGRTYRVTLRGRKISKNIKPPFFCWQGGVRHYYGANSYYVPCGALKGLVKFLRRHK